MKGHTHYAASGFRSTLFLTMLGCLLVAGLAGAIIRPASAARAIVTRLNANPVAAPQSYAPQIQELKAAPLAPAAGAQDRLQGVPLEGGATLELRDGYLSCRAASEDEARAMRRDPGQQLRAIGDEAFASNASDQARKGLKIILRGTQQLEQYPEAKAAFLRAARAWESLIQNPITVVIDVDFGPTGFGEPFGENQYGFTHFQRTFDATAYPAIRSALIRSAGSPQEAALDNSLPSAQLPTNLGATMGLIYHIAPMRALGLLAPVADPDAERATLGAPPSISFNSAIGFDFDPSDGIQPERIDFTASSMHEIGHALGFFSGVGIQELYPTAPPQTPDVLDMFRFRPGVTFETFATAPRVLSSGGEHIFFGGGPELPFSTGRPDETGGDGRQAGHWKDDMFTGRYIGIMDPIFEFSTRYEITANDLQALELIGYRTNPLPNPQEAELAADDGAMDGSALGNGAMVINRLTPPSYPATLRKLRIIIPSFKDQPDPAGKPITLLVYGASNGQLPPGAPFTRIATTVPSASADLFLEFTIPNGPTINSGDFYVGYQAPAPHQGVGFGVDLSGSTENRSFYSINNGASFAPLPDIYQGKPANAMIRAIVSIGVPQPTPTPTPTSGKVVSVSAANYDGSALASEEIVAAFGARLATTVLLAGTSECRLCLPTELGGTRVMVKDSAGAQRMAPLFFVSPNQVNYLMPGGTAVGAATVTVTSGDGAVSIGTAQIAMVAPGLFTANGDGQGAPAAIALRVKQGGAQSVEEVARYDSAQRRFVPRPLDLGAATDQVFLILFGTGLRHRQSLSTVSLMIGSVSAPIYFAGAQGDLVGVDQINALVPRSLIGRGEVDVALVVDGKPATTVRIHVQ
jgi:uncharacterized protein (TIGR03437 family)